VGLVVETQEKIAYSVGDHVLVSGRVYITEPFDPPLSGKIIGIALEDGYGYGSGRWAVPQYHVLLENGAHCYSLDQHLAVKEAS